MNMKNARDVSPFLLFEATADSEADCEGHVAANVDDDDNNDHDDDGDDDDAESCRGGLSDTSCVTTQMSRNDSTRSCFDSVMVKEEQQEGAEEKDDDDDGEGEVNSYGRWARKQIVAVDSSSDKERMSEMERSRLFWEACLAS